MSILDNAVAHFDAIGTREIEIPEWDTTLYVTPFTLAEKKALLKASKGDDVEFMTRTLILKAKDKEGEPVFQLDDKHKMMHKVHPAVLERVVGKIAEVSTIEEKVKK